MFFNQKKIYLVIALSIIALVGIIVVQVFWINSAYDNEEKKFHSEAKIIGHQLQDIMASNSSLQQALINLSTAENPEESKIIKYKQLLQGVADSLFAEQDTQIDFEFGLVTHHDKKNCCCHSQGIESEEVVFSTRKNNDQTPIVDTSYRTCASSLNGYAHLNFHYPNLGYYLLTQIAEMVILSLLCILIVVGCFAYTLYTIRKQKKLAEMKNDFLNNMTHEFKTPIFAISLASKALGKSKKIGESDKLSKYLNLISDETKRLKSQVNKVLKIALVDSKDAKLEKQEINLHELIQQVVSNFELLMSEMDGTVDLKLNASKHINADKTHISNILNNLIDNAIKYSKEKPDITIRTMDKKDGVIFSISDNGIGMDSETKKHIFEKFYRAHTGDIHNEKGFGLGLSYVKSIVESHNGWIKLKSKLNQGSTFTIFLPT